MIKFRYKGEKSLRINRIANDILVPFFNDMDVSLEFSPTGSMVYGSPNIDSDYDFICKQLSSGDLLKFANEINKFDGIDVRNDYGPVYNIKFKINSYLFNIIYLECELEYMFWDKTTDRVVKSPVGFSNKYYKDKFIGVKNDIERNYKILTKI